MDTKQKKFYGRRCGKQLTPNQKRLMKEVFPLLQLKSDFKLNPEFKKVHLDIGFGTGTNLVAKIQKNPDVFFIGAEPFINGVAQFLSYLSKDFYKQIALHSDDILEMWDNFDDEMFDKIYLLYPDPWPKKKHEKRRFVSIDNLNKLARILKTNSTIDIASDISEYLDLLRENLKNIDNLKIIYDSKNPYENWVTTKYEQKAFREGRVPQYITIQKI